MTNFDEQNVRNDKNLENTKTEFSDLCRIMERDLNELVNQLEVKVIQVRKMAEQDVVKKQQ